MMQKIDIHLCLDRIHGVEVHRTMFSGLVNAHPTRELRPMDELMDQGRHGDALRRNSEANAVVMRIVGSCSAALAPFALRAYDEIGCGFENRLPTMAEIAHQQGYLIDGEIDVADRYPRISGAEQ